MARELDLYKTEAQRSGFGFERKNGSADVEFSPPGGNGTERSRSDEGQ